MQEESGSKKGVNPVLEQHWEKIVLGVVVLLAVVFLASQFTGGGNQAVKNLVAASSNLKKTKEGTTDLPTPKIAPAPRISPPTNAEGAQKFTHGVPTKYIPDIKEKPPEIAAVFWLPKLTLNAPVAEFEGVKLSWSLNNEGKPEPGTKTPIEVKAASFFYRIERLKAGDVEWKVLEKQAKGDTLQYIDEGTTPKTEYQYKVTLGATDPVWIAKNPGQLTDRVGGPVSVRTLGIWKFDFSNHNPGNPDAEPPVPPQVWVKITKFDPVAGQVEWTRIHKQGALLGHGDEDGKITSVHLVPSAKRPGRTVPVDFHSGGKILKITYEKSVPHTYQLCEPTFVQGRGVVCDGPKKVSDPFKVNEVIYTDEEGKQQESRKITGPGPHPDQLCPDHGGAPPPKPISAEERAAAREEEATKLLEEADDLWAQDTPASKKEAQEKYKKLLSAYADTTAVKPRKSLISDRASAKLTSK
jgi:hypothetical protein